MPDNPQIPPQRKAVTEFKTPDQTIVFVTELVNRDDPAYVQNAPVKRGTLYKDIVGGDPQLSATHPLLYFCRELKYQQSDQLVIWIWSSDEHAHSSYNANITYELEAAGFPVYTREYTIRRDEYEQNPTLTIGSTLDALIGVTIADGGQDYTYATGEIADKDATITFVVSDGVIISGVVTNEGTGIVAGDTIIVSGDGAGASVIPMVQPTSAVLTAQKKEELPPDNPWANEFVKVTRVYQTLPGPTIHSTQLHVDGGVVDVATTAKVASTIVSGETLVGGTWTMTTKKQEDNAYVGQEIVSTRTVPGNPIKSTTIDAAGDIVTETRTLVEGPPTLVTVITTAGGVWTKTFAEALSERLTFGEEASDLVSWEIVQVKATQNTLDSYEVSIPDVVPEVFKAAFPITTHEDTLIGIASLPVLATGDLMRKQAQIDFNTYRLTVTGRAGLTYPQILVNFENTELYGGGLLGVAMTLDDSPMLPDNGLLVVSSEVVTLGAGLYLRTTKILDDSAWPILPSRLWDENTRQEYDEISQVIDLGTAEDPNPGVFGWVSEVKAIDAWRSKKINISKGAPDYVDEASALISYEYRPFRFPGWLFIITGAIHYFYNRGAHADLVKQKVRTWWIQSTNPPTPPTIDEIIMDNPIITNLNSSGLTYAGECLHDTFTIVYGFIPFFFPETTPSATVYTGTWIGTERVIGATVTPEREKDVWKIQTKSVVMR